MPASNMPPRPTMPRIPEMSPGSSVGQFNTQQQGALLQGQKQPNPMAQSSVPRVGVNRPVRNLELADNKVSTALDMRRNTLKNFIAHTDQQTKKNQVMTLMKRAAMQKTTLGKVGRETNAGVGGGQGMVSIGKGKYLRADAASAFSQMNAAFRQAGMGVLGVTSGYRSIAEQTRLYNGWLKRLPGFNKAAPPGRSNHNHGTAVDLSGYGGSTRSPQFQWLLRNAGRFGFSWSEGRSVGEPWHWVYVGG